MSISDDLVACKKGATMWESQLRKAAPDLAKGYEDLQKKFDDITLTHSKEVARLEFEENVRRELAHELNRVRGILFKFMGNIDKNHVARLEAKKTYHEGLPSWG